MHHAEPLGGAGERDVQVVVPARGLGHDAGRVDDQHRVELQPLGLAGGRTTARPSGRADGGPGMRSRDGVGQLVEPARGHEDGEGALLRVERGGGLGDGVRQPAPAPAAPTAGSPVGRTERPADADEPPAARTSAATSMISAGRAVVDGQLLEPPRSGHVRVEHLRPGGGAGRASRSARRRRRRSSTGSGSGASAAARPSRDSSCASSTITCPNAQVRSAAARSAVVRKSVSSWRSARPSASSRSAAVQLLGLLLGLAVDGPGAVQHVQRLLGVPAGAAAARAGPPPAAAESSTPSSSSASSSSGTSAGVHGADAGRRRRARSASVEPGAAAARAPADANRSATSCSAVSIGHSRSSSRCTAGSAAQLPAQLGDVGLVEQVRPRPGRSRPSCVGVLAGRPARCTRAGGAPARATLCSRRRRAGRASGSGRASALVEPQRRAVDLELHRCVEARPAGRGRRRRAPRPWPAGP